MGNSKEKGMIKSKYIWMDGDLILWDDANVHVLTHTLHYGLGVFEGIRSYKTENGAAIFRLKEHVDRLYDSAKIVGLNIPYKKEVIFNAVINTVKSNKLKSCYIRPLAFLNNNKLGLDYRGVDTNVIIATWPWGAYLGEEGLLKGIRTKVSSFTRHHGNISMTKAKVCGNYVNSIMAKAEAINNGYDEAIMLDVNGNVSEGSGENIFIVRGGVVKTPPLTTILDGITRGTVMEILRSENVKVVEEYFTRDELYIADEAFFSGTAAEITPIREVDGRELGNGSAGELTKMVQKTYFSIVEGKNSNYSHWLTNI